VRRRARTIVQQQVRLRASRPQLKRDPLGRPGSHVLFALLISLLLPARGGKPPVAVLRVGTTLIILDSTELDTVRVALGSTPTNESGDASTADHWLCYTIRDRGYHLRLESLEMNGPSIGAFWLGPATADTARGRCSPATFALSGVRTDRGVAIGMTRDSVQAVLGAPTRHRANWDEFSYKYRTLYSTFRAYYRGGVVTVMEGDVFHAE